VDQVLRTPVAAAAIARFGRTATTDAVRRAVAAVRESTRNGGAAALPDAPAIAAGAVQLLDAEDAPSLRRVFNLTGTVLHTNLGRALLPEAAIAAAVDAMRSAVALEFDIGGAARGERDDHVRGLIRELTGAEDASIVNNNAAAVLLVLNTFGVGKEAIVSRGELIEIGGAFRLPDIMARAGVRLVEVGTTNRTHLRDCEQAIGPKTGHPQGPSLQLPDRGFHQIGAGARAGRAGAGQGPPLHPRPRLRRPRRSRPLRPALRTNGARGTGRGCRPRHLLRRQAAGRPPDRHHRRKTRPRGPRRQVGNVRGDGAAHARGSQNWRTWSAICGTARATLWAAKNLAIWFAILTSFSGGMLDLGLSSGARM
jgi:hypothetical protein